MTQPSFSSVNSSGVAAPKSSSSLTFYYANCRSILPKMDELRYLVTSSSPPSVVALTETWLDQTIQCFEVCLPNYRLLRRDRSRHGGGVAIYLHDSIAVTTTFTHPSVELLSAVISTEAGSLLLGVMYRPPGVDADLSELVAALHALNLRSVTDAVIVGDFNVDLTEPSSPVALDPRPVGCAGWFRSAPTGQGAYTHCWRK